MRPFRPHEFPPDRCVTGPHLEENDGEPCLIFRCELCGTTSTDSALQGGCWSCDSGVLWR